MEVPARVRRATDGGDGSSAAGDLRYLWRPLPVARLFRSRSLRDPRWQWLLVGWPVATVAIIATGLLEVTQDWSGLPLSIGRLQVFITVFPPLILCTWLLFWLGFPWAFLPAYLATLTVSVYSGMELRWALLFSLADPLALAVYPLFYRAAPIGIDLRSFGSVFWFLIVSLIGALAGSSASFIWSAVHDLRAMETFAIWQGWWLGGFLQAALINAPVLALLSRRIEDAKARHFDLPPRSPVSLRWTTAMVLIGASVVAAFIWAMAEHAHRRVLEALTAVPAPAAAEVLVATQGWQLVAWTAVALVLATALGGVLLAGRWNRSLLLEVRGRTAQVRQGEERLRRMLEIEPAGVLVLDDSGRITFANAAAQEIMRPVAGGDLVGLAYDDRRWRPTTAEGEPLPVEQRPAARALLHDETVRDVELSYLRPDGSRLIVSVGAAPFHDQSGRVAGVIAVFTDITQRKRTEQELREKEERFRLVARATSNVIWEWDLTSGRLQASDAMQSVFGFGDAETGRTLEWWRTQIHPADRERVARGVRAVVEGDGHSWSDEYRFRRADGSYAMVLDRGYVARDDEGRPVRMIGSMMDITQRKEEEERQRFLADLGSVIASTLDYQGALHELARLAVAHIADWCLVDVQSDHRVQRVEIACADPARGARIAPRLFRHPPDLVDGKGLVEESLRAGRPMLVQEVTPQFLAETAKTEEHRRALEEIRPTSLMAVPLVARGSTLGAILFMAAESGRHYDRDDLEFAQEVARRAALAIDNARLYEATLEASKAKSGFLAVMSHELRTPLNAITGYTDLLLAGITGPLTPEQHKQLERTRASAGHLLHLIEQILTFSRMEAGREHAQRERVDAAELVRGIGATFGPLARERGLDLRIDAPVAPAPIETDARKLRQILLNLLSNAVKFTDRGEVVLTVAVEDGEAVFRVRDTGIGIAAEDLERIFDPFWQAEQGMTRARGGTGLGLTVSRRLARLLGGDVTASSRPGEGSSFTLRIPVRPPAEGSAAAA